MKKLGAEPAFPAHGPDSRIADWAQVEQPGMTKREYFAAMAMQNCDITNHPDLCERSCEEAAQRVVQLADALLAELHKENYK